MITVQFQVYLLVLVVFLFKTTLSLATTTPPLNFPIAKPNCTDRCGDVSIPFPFDTTENCYERKSFWVTCNETSGKLFMWDTEIEIVDISLDGQARLMQFIATNCYAQDGNWTTRSNPYITLPYLFTVNNTANKFTIIGCDSYGSIYGWRDDKEYLTGCTATCVGKEDLVDVPCGGLGCCQITSIPKNVWNVTLQLSSFNNHTRVWDFNNCSYGFLVEESAFTFSAQSFNDFMNVKKLPMIVDWVIENGTCESGQRIARAMDVEVRIQSVMCLITAMGIDANARRGTGETPIDDGCQDIDECASGTHKCVYKCVNSPLGKYTCSCPSGYLGDGIGDRGCHCKDGYTYNATLPEKGCNSGEQKIYKIVSGTAVGIILGIIVICLLCMGLKRRQKEKLKYMYYMQNGGMLLEEKLEEAAGRKLFTGRSREASNKKHMARIFKLADLENATKKFHKDMVIGQGGLGTVYKGMLADKTFVAIKKSKEVHEMETDQFINEIFVLSQISHGGVVKILGCCLETKIPLLVYEFINNGTLSDHIHNPERRHLLDWNLRLQIAKETAIVLWYLHSEAYTPIIHRDVKSANILLDDKYKARVADFGASRSVPMDQTQLSTMVQGTFGYLDPEYMQTNQLTEKSDVYSFGVVLVELITGKKPLDYARPEGERNLSNFFIHKVKQGKMHEILDETIVCKQKNLEQATKVAILAQACLNVTGEDRPSMKEVAWELEGLTGRRSWVKTDVEQGAEENKTYYGKGFDAIALNDEGHSASTSIGYDSLGSNSMFTGGR